MKKQRNKKLIRIFLLLLATSIYIFTNLSWHQIYYYTHSQKTDKRLTPIIVVYNLGEVMFKPKRETDGKYEYVSPGNAIVFKKNTNSSISYGSGDKSKKLHSLFRALLKTRSIPSYKKEGTLALQFPARV
ncbi:hypothetical protein, partial [Streptococcus danieliae]|uniref:hypothetical protein n=1 Tax=Streptococcus danieliae TaxID=747656 RepID=UPI0021C689E2